MCDLEQSSKIITLPESYLCMICEDITHKRASTGIHQVAEALMYAYAANDMLH